MPENRITATNNN